MTAPSPLKRLLPLPLIYRPLEGIVQRERLAVGKGKVLHEYHSGDAARRIDPEVGVVDPTPAQAARASAARLALSSDHEPDAPFVPSVGDEGEVAAALGQRRLHRANTYAADVISPHRSDSVRRSNADAVQRPLIEQHLKEADVVWRRRGQSAAADGLGHRHRWLNRIDLKRAVWTPAMDEGKARLPIVRLVVRSVGHAQRAENVISEIDLEALTRKCFDDAACPIDARAVKPLLA